MEPLIIWACKHTTIVNFTIVQNCLHHVQAEMYAIRGILEIELEYISLDGALRGSMAVAKCVNETLM